MAALNFPIPTVDGQVYTNYRWEVASNSWVSIRPIGYTGSAGTGIVESYPAFSVVGRANSDVGATAPITAGVKQVLARDTTANLAFQTITMQFLQQPVLEDSNTSITLSDATHHGRTLVTTAASGVTITLPNTVGYYFSCAVIQGGVGSVSFTTSGGANVHNYHNHSNIIGQYAACTISVFNTSGNIKYLLQGETS